MPRHEPHSGGVYTKPVVVKFNDEGLVALDLLRGKTPRGAYLRGLLRAENQRQRGVKPKESPTPKRRFVVKPADEA